MGIPATIFRATGPCGFCGVSLDWSQTGKDFSQRETDTGHDHFLECEPAYTYHMKVQQLVKEEG